MLVFIARCDKSSNKPEFIAVVVATSNGINSEIAEKNTAYLRTIGENALHTHLKQSDN